MDSVRLNQQQHQAVTSDIHKHLLIIAAAGAGKTQVLTTRIAHMIKQHGVDPAHILAVTFTKKAAKEMCARALKLSGAPEGRMTIGTFHSICARILRRNAHKLGFTHQFRILDADEADKVRKDVAKAMGTEDSYALHEIGSLMENWRNAGLEPGDVEVHHQDAKLALSFYRKYRAFCKRADVIDFSDLLMHTQRLFKNHLDVINEYRERWKFILVDEYQDTNGIQYELIKMLSKGNVLTVVGDDYQAIHEWRGACVRNILEFESDFPDVKVVLLETNYRSRANILEAASHVIRHNQNQRRKRLIPTKEVGTPIHLMEFKTDTDEATWVVQQIKRSVSEGRKRPSQFAILYRTNAQSQALEKELVRLRIPHKIHGSLTFYERKEIKDVLSYMRLIYNPHSDIDFDRVVNIPSRGLGDATVKKLHEWAQSEGVHLYQAAFAHTHDLKGRAKDGLVAFIGLIETLKEKLHQVGKLSIVCKDCIESSGYLGMLRDNEDDERIENLEKLIDAMTAFEEDHPTSTPQDFFDDLALYASETIGNATDSDAVADVVHLMTLHASKGLEFDFVFMIGMAEHIFPHHLAINQAKIEEERRLCYVGFTRAKEQLVLTYPKHRNFFFHKKIPRSNLEMSRFVAKEVPKHLFEHCTV